MARGIRARYREAVRRVRRFERREVRDLRRWVEETENLVHLSVLVFVPLLIGAVTLLSNTVEQISFLLFPPLAAGTYTLFADPEGRYASPWRFVVGLTVGAFSGWVALEVAANVLYDVPVAQFDIRAGAAALGIFLTAVATWTLDVEEPAAYSTALLVLVTATSELAYVASVALSSAIVAGIFSIWRRNVYERRAHYLYGTVEGDDHVLVPLRGERAETVARFAAHIAAAHEAGKVVLLDVVPAGTGGEDEGEREVDDATEESDLPATAAAAAERGERLAARIRREHDVPCEVVVAEAGATDALAVVQTARETNSDLVVAPYEERDGRPSAFVRGLLSAPVDVIVFRPTREADRWRRILIPVRKPGDVAHAMIDFADRLAGDGGRIAVSHCIERESQRRRAEAMLATLVETFEGRFETRVSNADVGDFMVANCPGYDLTVIGSSTDRPPASRLVSPPTFRRIRELDCDVAIVHRG